MVMLIYVQIYASWVFFFAIYSKNFYNKDRGFSEMSLRIVYIPT